jgi:hypothetical protein
MRRELGRVMPRTPASITQADIARTIRAAKQAGAAEVEVRIGEATMVVRIVPSTSLENRLNKRARSSFD